MYKGEIHYSTLLHATSYKVPQCKTARHINKKLSVCVCTFYYHDKVRQVQFLMKLDVRTNGHMMSITTCNDIIRNIKMD